MLENFKNPVSRNSILIYILLLAPNLCVFYLFRGVLLEQILSSSQINADLVILGQILYALFVAFSAIIENYIVLIINKKQIIFYYIFYSIFVNSLFFVFKEGLIVILLCALSGGAYGFGFPLIVSLISDNTPVEKRGRISGMILFFCLMIFMVSLILSSLYSFTLIQYFIMIIILQMSSLLSIPNFKLVNFINSKKVKTYYEVLSSNYFLFFYIPWIMFNFSNAAGSLILVSITQSETLDSISELLKFVSSSIFLLVSGMLADKYGRKLPLLIGFVVLGFTFTMYGLLNNSILYLVSSVLSGIAWGSILISYLFVILGDLSPRGSRDMYYSLGVISTMLLDLLYIFIGEYLRYRISANILSPIISISLFVSVIPLLYAPETMPEDKISDRKINDYLNKVLKILDSSNENN